MAERDTQYDVFLVHSSDDKEVATKIKSSLSNKGLRVYANYDEGRSFGIGKPTVDSRMDAGNTLKIFLILLTPITIKNHLVSFEIFLSLGRSHREGSMCCRLCMVDISEEQRQKYQTGELKHIPSVMLDFSRDDWVESLYASIKDTEKSAQEEIYEKRLPNMVQPASEEFFASITHTDVETDKDEAKTIMQFLGQQGKNFTNGEPNRMQFEVLEKSRWNIFIFSKPALADRFFKMQFDDAINASIHYDELQVIPVLSKGMKEEDVPAHYKLVTLLSADEPNHVEKLWNVMSGPKTKMTEKIHADEVYKGMGWAYLLNYFPLALLETTAEGRNFQQRFEDAMNKYNIDCDCFAKVFIIIPASCSFPPPGSQFDGEEHIGALEPFVLGFRKSILQLYRITTSKGQKYCYAREYATPVTVMHEVAKTYPFAGLSKEALFKQTELVMQHLKDEIKTDKFKKEIGALESRVRLVNYDDMTEMAGKRTSMVEALEREIILCLETERPMQLEPPYEMNYPKRGKAIIINNKTFTSILDREGTDVDAENLEKLFKDMGFEPERYNDLRINEMHRKLSQAAEEDEFNSQADCFICAILTHGGEDNVTHGSIDYVSGVEGESIEVQRLLDLFRGDVCKSLFGKPKIFFIQACRGKLVEHGVHKDSQRIPDTEGNKIPTNADFLIAYSTVQGYSSWRDHKDGSWFVQALCRILTNHWKEQDLLTMMTQVNMEVARFETDEGYKEMSSVVSMLRKKILFTEK